MSKKKVQIIAVMIVVLLSVSVFSGFASDISSSDGLVEGMEGKKIGVETGSVFDMLVKEKIPGSQIEYLNSPTDLAIALDTGKIDGYVLDEPMAKIISSGYPDQEISEVLSHDNYGFIFSKNSEKSDKLRGQINEYLAKIRADGTLNEIENIWLGNDESLQTVDMSGLSGENGTLIFATCTDTGAPFAYLQDGEYVGYDVDMAIRFCREYGYGIDIIDSTFSGLLASMASGKADFGGCCITITEERKESLNFSDPNYIGGCVLVVKDGGTSKYPGSSEDLTGKTIGVVTGTVMDVIARKHVPDCKIEYMNTISDLAAALDRNKVDAFCTDEPLARLVIAQYKDQYIYTMMQNDEYGYIFPKGGSKHDKILTQLNEYLAVIKADGTLEEIDSVWFGSDEAAKTVDLSGLTAENGTLRLAISSDIGAPFAYVKDGKYVGYEVDIIVRFCREYGYGLEISDMNFTGLLASVSAGKSDFGAACITITEERKQSVNFSDPSYIGGTVLVAKKEVSHADPTGFFNSVRSSFEKTFVKESRWKLFLSGIGITLLITVVAALFGTALGFLVFLVYRKQYKFLNIIINAIMSILERTPVVVIIMILYYVIFGKVMIDAIWVSVIGFTLLFASSVIALLRSGVAAVDKGQREASLALGYTDTKAFLRVILPQAAKHFMPGYNSAVISLIKDTAIVGYIAVQDLTKISDIIRSRTYEAFFPLIASAVIYFALAWLLTVFVRCLQKSIDPSRRGPSKMLKGVKMK